MNREPHPFVLTLLQWFRENGRQLPWRDTSDPYAIWLSEIILQQTQVKQGWAYWERFMQQWPAVERLAAASEDEVLRLWQGLGYYSRARNLHFAAKQIVALGGFPTTIEGLRSLKGVGDYTAAAIGSIAFGLLVAVVDGNVYRVLSRYFGISTPINTTEGKKEFALLAQELVSGLSGKSGCPGDSGNSGNSGIYNQAIMDFGALQCTPQSPRCADCPLQESCVALREGRVGELPVKLKTLKVKERHLTYVYIRCQGYTAIHRRPAGDIWQGLWEPYLVERPVESIEAIENLDAQDILNNPDNLDGLHLGEKDGVLTLIASGVKHVLTHRVLIADFYLWQFAERPSLPQGFIWIPETDITHYAIPRLVQRLLDFLPFGER